MCGTQKIYQACKEARKYNNEDKNTTEIDPELKQMLELSGKYIKTGIIIMLQIFKRLYQDMGGMKKDTNKKSKEES